MSPEALVRQLSNSAVSPYKEVISYELLYAKRGTSLKKVSDMTVKAGKLPSQAIEHELGILPSEDEIKPVEDFMANKIGYFSVAINNTPTWPDKLADSARPTPLFYYQGDISLIEQKSISIVGSRKASEEGKRRAYQMARDLARNGIAVVSGLARGIDTAAMMSALEHDGKVIGVIGTPIDEVYPRENAKLQKKIGEEHLLISQVPFYKYANQSFKTRRYYFPERNELMAAVSDATIIIEASDTSGTLTQARACQHQGRELFILRSCYENEMVQWPKKWAKKPHVHIIDSSEKVISILYGMAKNDSRG